MAHIRIIGAGLAGCECALALGRRGHSVELIEMRPVKMTRAHQSSSLGELVCSNSFRSSAITNAVGLLKREMALLDSLVIRCGEEARVPAGDAFAVDPEGFAAAITKAIESPPNVTLPREEATTLNPTGRDFLPLATAPLPSKPPPHALNH